MIKTANITGSISRNAGGLFESVRRLVHSLADLGLEVRVYGTADRFTTEDIAAWGRIPVSAFQSCWPRQFGYSPKFFRELESYAPDISHTHGIWIYSSVATNQYFRRRHARYVISPHGMLDSWAIRNSRWKKAVAYLLYEKAHLKGASCLRALCASEACAMRQFGLKNPIAIIPNGIDLPPERPLDDWTTRRQDIEVCGLWSVVCGLKAEGRKVLLYLGRLHPKKGLANLLKAWKSVVRSQWSVVSGPSEWTLVIAGWDQAGHEAELKHLATELEIPWADVRSTAESRNQKTETISAFHFPLSAFSLLFLGPLFGPDKAAAYRACDAFILPSYSEGLPMVVLEAWAYGKPVLMTPECNLPEGFTANAAIRIDPNPESIAEGLRQMFEFSNRTFSPRLDAIHPAGLPSRPQHAEGLGARVCDPQQLEKPERAVSQTSALQGAVHGSLSSPACGSVLPSPFSVLSSPGSQLAALGAAGRDLVATRFAWPKIARDMLSVYEWVLGGGPKPQCVRDRI